mmetsp:Transcript_59415/g.128480  ORF Transcript_59415/g.128480 Transcript_59415/m.128480 type:complete len:277 (+) Transcript_59415:105-935(+)
MAPRLAAARAARTPASPENELMVAAAASSRRCPWSAMRPTRSATLRRAWLTRFSARRVAGALLAAAREPGPPGQRRASPARPGGWPGPLPAPPGPVRRSGCPCCRASPSPRTLSSAPCAPRSPGRALRRFAQWPLPPIHTSRPGLVPSSAAPPPPAAKLPLQSAACRAFANGHPASTSAAPPEQLPLGIDCCTLAGARSFPDRWPFSTSPPHLAPLQGGPPSQRVLCPLAVACPRAHAGRLPPARFSRDAHPRCEPEAHPGFASRCGVASQGSCGR